MAKLTGNTSISGLTNEEVELINVLSAKGIPAVSIFRRGLSEYEKELEANKIDSTK